MKVQSATQFTKVGYFSLDNRVDTKKNLSFSYITQDKMLKQNLARVYIISVDGRIKKIGGSNAKGGIRGTIAPYLSGNGGRPSDRTHGVNMFIHKALSLGKSVELYYATIPNQNVTLPSLTNLRSAEISPSYKPMEELCLKEYVQREGAYPPWNFQEAGLPWPSEVRESNAKLKNRSKLIND